MRQPNRPIGRIRPILRAVMGAQVSQNEAAVGESLVAYGAPLAAWTPHRRLSLEDALVGGLELARSNAAVMRTLPALVAQYEDALDRAELVSKARASGRSAELGLVLELAGAVFHRSALVEWAGTLAAAAKATPEFFFTAHSRFGRALAEERTPDVARRWGFWLNMPLNAFARGQGA